MIFISFAKKSHSLNFAKKPPWSSETPSQIVSSEEGSLDDWRYGFTLHVKVVQRKLLVGKKESNIKP